MADGMLVPVHGTHATLSTYTKVHVGIPTMHSTPGNTDHRIPVHRRPACSWPIPKTTARSRFHPVLNTHSSLVYRQARLRLGRLNLALIFALLTRNLGTFWKSVTYM